MKTSEMFPSKYLKGDDLKGTPTVKIASVVSEVVGKDNEQKHVVYFEGLQKGMVLNRTNSDTIEGLYGDDTDDWIGEEVQLFSMPVAFQGKVTNACRVRDPKRGKKTVKAEEPKPLTEELNDEVPF
jgi:hypothetical protein